MIPGSKPVTITRLGMTFTTIERLRDWLDWWLPLFEVAFPHLTIRFVQATHSDRRRFPLSAGTHDKDDCWDLVIVGGTAKDYETVMAWLSAVAGAWGWWRHTGTWAARSAWHIHFGMLPPGITWKSTPEQVGRALKNVGIQVGEYVDGGYTTHGRVTTTSQIHDWLNDSLGLKGQHRSGADPAPRPKTLVLFDWKKYVADEKAWKADPMTQFVKEARALCRKAGISRIYGARLLLKSAAADLKPGAKKTKVAAARATLFGVETPKR